MDIVWSDGAQTSFPYLWLRDNSACGECRVEQTTEKRFLLTSVPVDIAPASTACEDGTLRIIWPDGHASIYNDQQLRVFSDDDTEAWTTWNPGYVPQRVAYLDFLGDDATAASAIKEFVSSGAIILMNAPQEPNALESQARD